MKIILFIFFYISISTAVAQEKSMGSFKLKGKVINRDTGLIYLRYLNTEGKDVRDTAHLDKGGFLFTGSVNGATRASLRGLAKSSSIEDPNSTSIFLENSNMDIIVTENNFKMAKIMGSQTQREAEALENSKKGLYQQKDSLNLKLKEMTKGFKSGDTMINTREKMEAVRSAFLSFTEKIKQVDYTFIGTHPGSYLSPYLLNLYFSSRKISLDSTETFFNKFTSENRTSTHGKILSSEISSRKSSSVGASAPLFSLTDVSGRTIRLEDFREKNYILLDFWASWCIPCRENIPNLKNLYQKYIGMGLDIISISCDTDNKAWLKAVEYEKMAWHQVIDPLPFQDGGLMMKYSVPSIPLLLLIDKKGAIIGRYENGLTLDLQKRLQGIFK